MKKKIENYLFGELVDFENKTHKITICAITHTKDNFRCMNIGISICNPIDTYNEEIGKKIAYGKAESSEIAMCANFGMITKNVVDLVLKQKMDHIMKFPETYIAGYDSAKNKFLNKQKAEKEFLMLNPEEQKIVQILKTCNNIDYYKKLAEELK